MQVLFFLFLSLAENPFEVKMIPAGGIAFGDGEPLVFVSQYLHLSQMTGFLGEKPEVYLSCGFRRFQRSDWR